LIYVLLINSGVNQMMTILLTLYQVIIQFKRFKRNRSIMSDYSLTTFGASGELTQVRYALTAVGNGETCLGIRAKNGVVIACEKKITSVLVDESSIHKVEKIAPYLGVTYAGIGPDFSAVLLKARKDVQIYHSRYQDRITPFMLCK
jgi:20S proteasome alpha/beta subunit